MPRYGAASDLLALVTLGSKPGVVIRVSQAGSSEARALGRRFGSRRCTSPYIYGSGKLTRVVGSLYKNLREISLFQVQDVTNQDSAAKPRQTFKITFTTKPHHVTSSSSASFTSSHVSTDAASSPDVSSDWSQKPPSSSDVSTDWSTTTSPIRYSSIQRPSCAHE